MCFNGGAREDVTEWAPGVLAARRPQLFSLAVRSGTFVTGGEFHNSQKERKPPTHYM
jgi:hypothetical protein